MRLKQLPLNDRSRTDNSPYLRKDKEKYNRDEEIRIAADENPEGEDKEFIAEAKTLRSKGDKKRHEIQQIMRVKKKRQYQSQSNGVIKRVYTNLRDTILGSEKDVTKSKSDKESNKKIMEHPIDNENESEDKASILLEKRDWFIKGKDLLFGRKIYKV